MSSILETFFILFKTNSEEVTATQGEATAAAEKTAVSMAKVGEAAEGAEAKIKESSAAGAFEIKELDAVVRRFGVDFVRQTAEWASGLLGFLAVEKLVDSFFENAEMVEHLGEVSKELQMNVSDLDAWEQAVKRAGGSTDDFENSMRHLNEKLAGLAIGAGGANGAKKFFADLGISAADAKKPIAELLPQLADAFSKMGMAQASGVGERLGLDMHTIALLHEGRQAVDDMIAHEKALGTITDENVEAAAKFHEAWSDVTDLMRAGSLEALADILPVLTSLAEGFAHFMEFLKEHKDLMEGFFIGLAAVITYVYGPAIAAAAIETIIATAPIWIMIIAIGAAIAAFAILWDDISNFLKGNNSIIGELSKKWPIIGQVVHDAANAVKAAVQVLIDFFQFNFTAMLRDSEKVIRAWGKMFIDIIDAISNEVMKLVHAISSIKLPGGTTIGAVASTVGNAASSAAGAIENGANRLNNFIYGPDNGQQANIRTARTYFDAANNLPPPPGAGAAGTALGGSGSPQIVIQAPVTQTITSPNADPAQVAKHVNDKLSDHISHAINHYADGVSG